MGPIARPHPSPGGLNGFRDMPGNAAGMMPFNSDRTALVVFALILCFVSFLLFLAAAILITRQVLRHLASRAPRTPSSALEELDTRYARGDIARDEYFTRRADLTQAQAGGGAAPQSADPAASKTSK